MKTIPNVTVSRVIDNEKMLQYYAEHTVEVLVRAAAGNAAAQKVQRRAFRLEKCHCPACENSLARAIDLYRLSTLN